MTSQQVAPPESGISRVASVVTPGQNEHVSAAPLLIRVENTMLAIVTSFIVSFVSISLEISRGSVIGWRRVWRGERCERAEENNEMTR